MSICLGGTCSPQTHEYLPTSCLQATTSICPLLTVPHDHGYSPISPLRMDPNRPLLLRRDGDSTAHFGNQKGFSDRLTPPPGCRGSKAGAAPTSGAAPPHTLPSIVCYGLPIPSKVGMPLHCQSSKAGAPFVTTGQFDPVSSIVFTFHAGRVLVPIG